MSAPDIGIAMPDLIKVREVMADRHEYTDNQILFAFYFSVTRNGMYSVRMAGYKCSTPGSESTAANRLRRLPKIQDLVAHFDKNPILST